MNFQHKEANALKAGPGSGEPGPKPVPKQVIKAESKLFQWRHSSPLNSFFHGVQAKAGPRRMWSVSRRQGQHALMS